MLTVGLGVCRPFRDRRRWPFEVEVSKLSETTTRPGLNIQTVSDECHDEMAVSISDEDRVRILATLALELREADSLTVNSPALFWGLLGLT